MKKRRIPHVGKQELRLLELITLGDIIVSHLNSGYSVRGFYRNLYERGRERQKLKRIVRSLEAKDFLESRGKKGETVLEISARARALLSGEINFLKNKESFNDWNGEWHIITFDIPVASFAVRRALRSVLKRAGFYLLQQSVYVHPFPCDELLKFIYEDSRLL